MVARNTIYEFLIHSGLMIQQKQHGTSQLSRTANLQRGDMTYHYRAHTAHVTATTWMVTAVGGWACVCVRVCAYRRANMRA